MTSSTKQLSYYNVLIFTIITGILSLILLLLLFFDEFKEYIKFVITVEIGLFTIIIWCIYSIIRSSKKKQLPDLVINYGDCPDYYVKNKDNSGIPYCENGYIYKGAHGDSYTMSIFNASAITNPTTIFGSGSNNPKSGQPVGQKGSSTWFPYTDSSLVGGSSSTCEKANSSLKNKCAMLFSDPKETDANAYMAGTKDIPWTYMQSRCEAYLPNGGNAGSINGNTSQQCDIKN